KAKVLGTRTPSQKLGRYLSSTELSLMPKMFLTPDSCVLKDVQNRSPAGGRGGSDGRNSLGKRCPLKSFLLSLFAGCAKGEVWTAVPPAFSGRELLKRPGWVTGASEAPLGVCSTWGVLGWFGTTAVCVDTKSGNSELCISMRRVEGSDLRRGEHSWAQEARRPAGGCSVLGLECTNVAFPFP
uniref:Uncharacterized protein n=1 Tax=Anser cygnoides TaxID=8845 RepID=A0A8B9IFU4_ANSCY